MFGLLKTHRLTFQDRHDVGGDVSSLAFRAEKPVGARAGQHGILMLGPTMMKPMSLASAPEEGNVIIGTSLTSGSTFKRHLARLQPGDAVTLRGPIDTFTLDGSAEHVVMLAQGIGITPFRSMLAHISFNELPVVSTLIHVANAGHAFRHETEPWATSASYPQHADDFRAATTGAAHDHPHATFYVAGAPAFVSSTAKLLKRAGIPGGSIRKDKYLFYKPSTNLAAAPSDRGNGSIDK